MNERLKSILENNSAYIVNEWFYTRITNIASKNLPAEFLEVIRQTVE